MRRRDFLSGAVCLCLGLAGCGAPEQSQTTIAPEPRTSTVSSVSDSTVHSEHTTTLQPTLQARYRPVVIEAGLVSGWSASGDLRSRRIDTVTQGAPAVIAFRYRVRLPAGTTRFRESVAVENADGDIVARTRQEVRRSTEEAGTHIWEHAVAFETDGWSPGQYTAIVAVGNLELHRVSEPVTTTFRVEP